MLVRAESLMPDDIVMLKAGPRAIQPEHTDLYFVLSVADYDPQRVEISMVDMWSNKVVQILAPRNEAVEVNCVSA